MIKIRGGKYLHRLLKQPPLEITRSTKDVCKEGMFNSLGNITNYSFLDLFGGSGSIGIEAYSRGANPVYINDKNREAYKVILDNLKSLGISDIKTFNLDYKVFLKALQDKDIRFDIIFLDPPYKMIINDEFIDEILSYNILQKNGIIIAETDYDISPILVEKYQVKILKYGRSKINILRTKLWKLQYTQGVLTLLQMVT